MSWGFDVPQVLVTHRPEATTALLMQLCTPGERDSDWVTQVADFAHIYSERCRPCEIPRLSWLIPLAWPCVVHTCTP